MDEGVKYMGIVNLTGNSFVQADRMGRLAADEVVKKVGEILSEGADIIDVGACSTAPGNAPVLASVEWERFGKILPSLFSAFPGACFSIDSFHITVLRKAYALASVLLDRPDEQFIVNDVSGASHPSVLGFAANLGLQYVATCNSSDPSAFFRDFSAKASSLGLERWILDPGFGFGKDNETNWNILHHLDGLNSFGKPVLCALSRKSMIYKPLGLSPDTCAEQSAAAERLAISHGAGIIRTHDLILHKRKS